MNLKKLRAAIEELVAATSDVDVALDRGERLLSSNPLIPRLDSAFGVLYAELEHVERRIAALLRLESAVRDMHEGLVFEALAELDDLRGDGVVAAVGEEAEE